MKTEIAARIVNVARQSPESGFSKTAPNEQTDGDQETADDHEIFADCIHGALRLAVLAFSKSYTKIPYPTPAASLDFAI